ncbi:FO synthase [Paradesulfitobacterium ferrireducens]|uniref:FO synthase n=1 Tax=Paradesulfitobacterium ferrireducens TaxID=2816476 RepID=UPI001A8E38D4|nr:FO synthase [Paradesulfitobacterium ferrireducens]
MLPVFDESELADLIIKVENGERLALEEGMRLMSSNDILALGYMANIVRERLHGDKTYFRAGLTTEDPILIKTTATILYTDLKTPEERVQHLLQLRALQDETGRFETFAPLPDNPKNVTSEGGMGVELTTGFEDLRLLAGARILLDNFKHIKAFGMVLGPKLAQVSLAFGVDELDGTVSITKEGLIRMIRKAGREPVERDDI